MTCKPRFKPAAYVLLGSFPLSIGQLAAAPLDLQQQVVTATRTAQTAQQSLAAVTVIDRERIERSQANSLPELLKQVPGVSLANNGGPGKSTSLFMRGTESDHVLVMIDGIKIGSVSGGGAALQDLPLELIERIEVVRGPRSSLYGSEAIGGVIQIFTRKGQEWLAKRNESSASAMKYLQQKTMNRTISLKRTMLNEIRLDTCDLIGVK